MASRKKRAKIEYKEPLFSMEDFLHTLPSELSSSILENLNIKELSSLGASSSLLRQLTAEDVHNFKTCDELTTYGSTCNDSNFMQTAQVAQCADYCRLFLQNPFTKYYSKKNLNFFLDTFKIGILHVWYQPVYITHRNVSYTIDAMRFVIFSDNSTQLHLVNVVKEKEEVGITIGLYFNNKSELQKLFEYYLETHPRDIHYSLDINPDITDDLRTRLLNIFFNQDAILKLQKGRAVKKAFIVDEWKLNYTEETGELVAHYDYKLDWTAQRIPTEQVVATLLDLNNPYPFDPSIAIKITKSNDSNVVLYQYPQSLSSIFA